MSTALDKLSITLLVIAIGMMAVACSGERTLKAAGEQCSATSECEATLLCDFAAEPPVCAGQGSGPLPTDAGQADGAPAIDAAPIDAPAVDASAAAP